MKYTIMVVGGLLFAGTSLAAEPQASPNTVAASGLKVGIDAKTGKRRQLSAEESAALDAQSNKLAAKTRTVMGKGTGLIAPATYEESVAGGVSKNGINGYLAPVEAMSSITATIDANGKVTVSENGQPVAPAREVASE